jgi:hypothetical protein
MKMSDMYHDEWRLATFGGRIATTFRIISMSTRQLWPLIIMALVACIVGGWLSIMIETYINDGSPYWYSISSQLQNLTVSALYVLFFGIYLIIAMIAYLMVMQQGVTTWRKVLSEWFAHLRSVMWVILIYVLIVVVFAVGLFGVLISFGLVYGYDDGMLMMSVALTVILTGWVIADVYVGFYWSAVMMHNKRGFEALYYSYHLVKGRWLWVLLNKMAVWLVLCPVFLVCIVTSFFMQSLYTSLFGDLSFDAYYATFFSQINFSIFITGMVYVVYVIVLSISLQYEPEQHTAPLPTV